MDHCTEIGKRIQAAAECAARNEGVLVADIAQYLRFGETTEAGGNRQVTLKSLQQDAALSRAKSQALRALLDLLSELLPTELRMAVPVGREAIQERIEPMVRGLVPDAWQEVAISELVSRTNVLDLQGARNALEAELSTGYTDTAWQVLWASFEDYGLAPMADMVGFAGVSAGSFAHCRLPTYHSKDPYADIVVHEAAHLLHYLKPERFELPVRKGQERFVDVDYYHRELFAYSCEAFSRVTRKESRASRVLFAEGMREGAFSFPSEYLGPVSSLVIAAARARNGWRIIRDATVIRTRRRLSPASLVGASPDWAREKTETRMVEST